jgi:hypothetical protein
MTDKEKWKYGMFRGKFIADMTHEELLETILYIGEENWSLRTKPCIHDEIKQLLPR